MAGGDNEPEVERVGGKLVYKGPIASVRIDQFKLPDGDTVERQVVVHPGAVVMVPYDLDSRTLYMVRQPRVAVGDASLLELPAGKLDVEGEAPLDAAKRELAEEIGKRAASWREVKRFYSSPGFTNEECWLYFATDLSEASAEPDPEERIEPVGISLQELDRALEECQDAKSLVGLYALREELR